jgi:hypothetical protein
MYTLRPCGPPPSREAFGKAKQPLRVLISRTVNQQSRLREEGKGRGKRMVDRV